jgi:type IV secretion system protein TrbL
MIRPMSGVALKYLLGLTALVFWPFGWVIAAVVTNAMLDAAATASLLPFVASGSMIEGPALTVLLIGAWMIVSSALAPYVTTKVLMMGANPVAALAQGVGGVAHATIAGGAAAAATAVSGGAGAAGVIAAAAVGALASGAESSARGGGPARTTAVANNALSGMYGGADMRRRTAAHERGADAFADMAASARFMAQNSVEQAAFFRELRRRMNRQETRENTQPHHPDPNREALDIELYVRR